MRSVVRTRGGNLIIEDVPTTIEQMTKAAEDIDAAGDGVAGGGGVSAEEAELDGGAGLGKVGVFTGVDRAETVGGEVGDGDGLPIRLGGDQAPAGGKVELAVLDERGARGLAFAEAVDELIGFGVNDGGNRAELGGVEDRFAADVNDVVDGIVGDGVGDLAERPAEAAFFDLLGDYGAAVAGEGVGRGPIGVFEGAVGKRTDVFSDVGRLYGVKSLGGVGS